jgi:hypothetical protein
MVNEFWPHGKFKDLRASVVRYSKYKVQALRAKGLWVEGLHWRYDIVGGDILFNLRLIQDWIATGGGQAHQKAIESYLASLPSNQVPSQTSKTPKSKAGKAA